jgi:methyltransferase-like protein/2-polyprenyl-3-methyl-5-hydroxy-6-metoxy-1,4-benzoquinol methylase
MPAATSAPLAAPPTNTYDEVPYESHPYAQSHPSRMAVIATLFGLSPPPVETCRVLELGAAAGGNLIPMAETLPGARFVGIDLSARQVADGEQLIRKLGLDNVSLRHASITEVDESYGKFDYVIAHGVFSWVPTEVREKMFDICAKNLNPHGVAYISYNTYPGWHMRGMIRDMMRYHANRFATPQLRTQQARALLDFLAQSVRQEGPYSVLLKTELETLRHQADHYLYHEHLEPVNDPLYFHTFVERAAAHGLRYLGEARIGTMVTGNFGPEVEKALKLLASDQIQTEQYMDFIRNRMFRETLLVHAKNPPNWTINPDCTARLHVASGSKPTGTGEPDVTSDATIQYQTRTGMTLSTSRPLLKAAMLVLSRRWPGTVPFDELRQEARALAGGTADPAEDARALALGLLNSYISSDLVELHAVPLPVSRAPGERPTALGSARLRAAAGATAVANRRHELVRLNDLNQRLVPLLDGTRDRTEIIDRLTERALTGDLNVQKDNQKLTDPADVKAALAAVLDPALNELAAHALLVE